jgi:hypothetical protein
MIYAVEPPQSRGIGGLREGQEHYRIEIGAVHAEGHNDEAGMFRRVDHPRIEEDSIPGHREERGEKILECGVALERAAALVVDRES